MAACLTVRRLVFTFRNGAEATAGMNKATTASCELEEGEYVTGITTYSSSENHIRFAMAFHTTRKVCGPYGDVKPAVHTMSGNKLLYMTGRGGHLFDEITVAFAGGCSETSWIQ